MNRTYSSYYKVESFDTDGCWEIKTDYNAGTYYTAYYNCDVNVGRVCIDEFSMDKPEFDNPFDRQEETAAAAKDFMMIIVIAIVAFVVISVFVVCMICCACMNRKSVKAAKQTKPHTETHTYIEEHTSHTIIQ